MSGMVERVFLAIAKSVRLSGGEVGGDREIARDAIKAMRQPTPAMIQASDGYCDAGEVAVWQGMIDEALKERTA